MLIDLLGKTEKQSYYPKEEVVILGKIDEEDAYRHELEALMKKSTYQEIEVSFGEEGRNFYSPDSRTSIRAMVDLGREIIGNSMDIQEVFLAIFFSAQLTPIGYIKLNVGTSTMAPVYSHLLWGIALKTLAESMVVFHNHPSGNITPSDADIKITKTLQKQAKIMNIGLLDHIILSHKNYYSFSNETAILNGIDTKAEKMDTSIVIQTIEYGLKKVTKTNSPFVFENIQTQAGKTRMVEGIVRRMIATNLSPNEIIPQIEQEYGNNIS